MLDSSKYLFLGSADPHFDFDIEDPRIRELFLSFLLGSADPRFDFEQGSADPRFDFGTGIRWDPRIKKHWIYRDNFFTFLQNHENLHEFVKHVKIFTSLPKT